MSTYDPSCDNCFMCRRCGGNGWIDDYTYRNGEEKTERKTCPECDGRGGRRGAGEHDHR
jgi:hypothetical protein